MVAGLNAEQVRSYRERGYLAPLRVLAPADAAGLVSRMDAFAAARPDDAEWAFRNKPHILFPWLYDLAREARILDAVEALIGPDILLWSSGFFTKPANDPAYVTWHQDSTYWGLEPVDDIVTAWLAFTPSVPESGCMRVVPGTHTLGQVGHRDTFAAGNLLSRGQEVDMQVAEQAAVDLVLQPGEMSLHHVRIVHGSQPNRSAWPRIGLTFRYIPTRVRQVGDRPTAVLVRGEDRYGHFEAEPRPQADFDAGAVACHQEIMGRLNAVLYDGADERPAAE